MTMQINMYCKAMLLLFLVNGVSAILISKNDVSCSADGSVNVRKSALGILSTRIYAFGGGGPFGHCHRMVREDVVKFQRPKFEDSPVRMIIDDDQTPDAFHILDVQCTIIRPDTITHDEAHARERRAGMYRKDKVPERDENGKLVVGPEVNNTGLDAEGNLVKDRNFDVNVGMTVNVPYSDNAGIEIRCQSGSQISVSNPNPDLFQYFLAYDDRGNLCQLSVRPDRSWLVVTNCDTNSNIKVAFNDRQFVQGVIGGKSILRVYKINCLEILGKKLPVPDFKIDQPNIDGYYYYHDYMYDYDYPNSGPGLTGTVKQVCLLMLTLAAVLFMERLAYVS